MQRSKFTAIAAAAFLAGAVGVQSAQASSTSIRSGPVATANENGAPGALAITDDANLANRIFNSITVSVPTGQDWTNSEIRIALTTGTVYNAAGTAGTQASPNSDNFTTAGRRQSAYDTFVNSKPALFDPSDPTSPIVLQPATILGKLNPDNTAGEPPAIGLSGQGGTEISVAWGNTVGGEAGTFQIGQFTLSADATGTFFGRTFATDQPGGAFHIFQGNVVGGVLVPEPTSLAALLAVGGGLLLRRRRRTA